MRWRNYLLVTCVLILCISPSIAEVPDLAEDPVAYVSANPEWIVANSRDSTVIQLNITDPSGNPIPNLSVDFSVNNSILGFVYPDKGLLSDSNGMVNTTFRSKTVSGTAEITATISYKLGGMLKKLNASGLVYIDHDTPYAITYLSYPTNETVGSIQNIYVGMKDFHGNIVDNRNITEYIGFSIITRDDESRFWNATASNFSSISTTIPVDDVGIATANITLGTAPGETLIRVQPPGTVSEKTLTITRVADGIPQYMVVHWDPSVPYVPADNESYFVFSFILYDEYGNGLNNKEINVTSSAGPEWGPLLVTTISGVASAQYGPYPQTFNTTVTAFAVENESVIRTLDVEFYNYSATDILLTINPITMPSHEFNTSYYATATAVVVDKYGKPVKGEDVNFDIYNIDDNGFNMTGDPFLEGIPDQIHYSTTTNDEGLAFVKFYPGAFSRDFDLLDYSDSATGSCDIVASWGSDFATVSPIWKNYPYLSVSTWVDDPYVTVNDTINVSLRVKGDGFALLPKPIDLILCVNRGSSMLGDMYWQNDSAVWADKMVYLYDNSPYLINELNETYRDRVGLVSFGVSNETIFPDSIPGDDNNKTDDDGYREDHYGSRTEGYYNSKWDYAAAGTIDSELNKNYTDVLRDIYNTSPFGDRKNQNHVPMRHGLYLAIEDMMGYRRLAGDTPSSEFRSNSVKAIVLLSDSDWNDYGDPIAGWDGADVNSKLGYTVSEKDPTRFPESGRSQWTAFESFYGSPINDTALAKQNINQNLAYYAQQNGIMIFPIAYFRRDQNVPTALNERFSIMAEMTGGTYYRADSGEKLKEIFEEIGRKLRQEAGVNTTATLNFSQVKLNNITVPGNQAFDYFYQINLSTVIAKWNATAYIEPPHTDNQTDDWNEDQKLNFDLGTMYLGDIWQGNFSLIAKETGTVEFFGNGSEIVFNEGSEVVTIPGAFEYSQPIRFGTIPTEYLYITHYDVDPALKATYSINYTGDKTVHVKLYYLKTGDITGKWIQYASLNYQCNGRTCGNILDENILNKWILAKGTYDFKIEAWAQDAPMDVEYDSQPIPTKFFIWLK